MANGRYLSVTDGEADEVWYLLADAICCGEKYPVALNYRLGRCKKCGRTPVPIGPRTLYSPVLTPSRTLNMEKVWPKPT
jgi:hypothetical protein